MASPREELVKHTQRYKEMVELMEKVASAADSGELTDEENKLICFAYKNAMAAGVAYRRIIASIKKQKEENDDHVSVIRDFPTEIDPGRSMVDIVMLKVYDSRRIPFATSGLDKVNWLKRRTHICSHLAEVKTGPEREEAIENTLSTFKAAQDIAREELAPTHPKRLELALALSDFHYRILNSPDVACNIAQQAVDEAMAEVVTHDEAKGELVALGKAKRELAVEPEAVNKLDTPELMYKYSVTVNMVLLRRSIKMWTSMMQDNGVTEGKKKTKKSRMMSNRGKKEEKKQDDGAESSVTMAPPREELVKQAECYKEIVELMEKVTTATDSGELTEGKKKKKKSRTMDGAESIVIRTPSNQPTAAVDHEMEEAAPQPGKQ